MIKGERSQGVKFLNVFTSLFECMSPLHILVCRLLIVKNLSIGYAYFFYLLLKAETSSDYKIVALVF